MTTWSVLRGLQEKFIPNTGERTGAIPSYLSYTIYVCVVIVVCGIRWATKKAAGSTRNGRKSAGRRLGLKCGDGMLII